MIAAAIVTVLYYRKFLSRADWHVAHAFAPRSRCSSMPFIGCCARWRNCCQVGTRKACTRSGRRLAFLLIASSSDGVLGRISGTGLVCSSPVRHEPLLARVGWSNDSVAPLAAQVATLERFLASEIGRSEPIFDFTNQPGLYHFLLDRKPASRFFHVSMAIRPATQQEVISDLKRTRPPLIVYRSDTGGLGGWDGIPSVVRHHEISRFVSTATAPGRGLWTDVLRGEEQSETSLPPRRGPRGSAGIPGRRAVRLGVCAEVSPARAHGRRRPGDEDLDHRRHPSRGARLGDQGGPVRSSCPGRRHGRTAGARRSRHWQPSSRRCGHLRTGDRAVRVPSSARVGFERRCHASAVRLLGVASTGEAAELPIPGMSPPGGPPASVTVGEWVIHVVPGSVLGSVDEGGVVRERVTAFDLPVGLSAPQVAGVQLEGRVAQAGTVAISTGPPDLEDQSWDASASRGVVLRLSPSPLVKVRVELDSCPAWKTMEGTRLYIRSDEGVEIEAIRPLARPTREGGP